MPITRSLALKIIKYLIDNPSFCFPFLVMCKGYGIDTDDNDFVEIAPENDYENLIEDSKGFLEMILNENAISLIEKSAKDYRELWKVDLCESTKIEEYGLNEFFGGKAEAFEESLEILKKSYKKLS